MGLCRRAIRFDQPHRATCQDVDRSSLLSEDTLALVVSVYKVPLIHDRIASGLDILATSVETKVFAESDD